MDIGLLQKFIVIFVAISGLIFLVVRVKLPAFFALLVVSALAGLGLGLNPEDMLAAIRDGMGNTLSFIAIIVGLGAMLGALLESSKGIQKISTALLNRTGTNNAPWALSFIGFLVAIPVFFDVGLIILMPMAYGLAKKSGKTITFYALPLAAGLAAAHAFIPPTPGPIAVADLLKADLGWVIIFGMVTALPAALLGGPVLVKVMFNKPSPPQDIENSTTAKDKINDDGPSLSLTVALSAILLPLILIIMATFAESFGLKSHGLTLLQLIGHPFSALLITLSFVYIYLRRKRIISVDGLNHAMAKALEPAAAVILVTGAGGAFKQVLIASGSGADIANAAMGLSLSPLLFGFIAATIVRIMQGSATVAMITSAGLTAPLVETIGLNAPQTALCVIAIAAGATAFSHVNDSGFWLVSRYLNLSPVETFKSWTLASTLVGLTGFLMALIFSFFF